MGADADEDALTGLVAGTTDAAFALHRELADGDNQFLSPFGVALALAMVAPGASDPVQTRLRDLLGSPSADDSGEDDPLHVALGSLRDRLAERGVTGTSGSADESFALSIADAAWGQTDYPFDPAYLAALAAFADEGGLHEVDYGQPERARDHINAWVAEATDGQIPDLLPAGSLDTQTRLVLTTALSFRARWEHPFDGAPTPRPFTALDGTDHEVLMLDQRRPWACAERDGTQVVELPYAGGDVAMLVILPPPGEFRAVERRLDADRLSAFADALEPRPARLVLPCFEFTWRQDLVAPLARLGLGALFDPDAGALDGIAETDEPLAVDGVYHETRVAVDAAGTEAAAATGTTIGTVSVQPVETEIVADRPFLFLIRDCPTGAVLFCGRAVDPAGWR